MSIVQTIGICNKRYKYKKLLLFIFILFLLNEISFSQYGKWTILNPKVISLDGTNKLPFRYGHAMAQLTENKVLMFGGQFDKWWVQYNDTWIYDYEINTWTEIKTENKPLPRLDMSMAQVTDGKVLLYGGQIPNNDMFEKDTIIEDAWIFDIDDMNWHKVETDTSPGPLTRCGLTKIFDNQVFLYGGTYNISKVPSKETWIYNHSENKWSKINTPNKPSFYRAGFGIASINLGNILIYGGVGPGGYFDDTWIFDFSINDYQQIYTLTQPGELGSQQMINLTNDYLLMFGGHSQNATDRTWIFDVKKMNWVEETNLPKPAPRYFFGMAKIQQGKAIVYGGGGFDLISDEYTWLYELDSNYIDVKKKSNKTDLRILSNNDELYIIFNNNNLNNSEIKIFNLNGTQVFSQKLSYSATEISEVRIDLSYLTDGVYFIQIYSGKNIYYDKFIKY